MFDEVTGEWAAMPELPVARYESVAAALPDSSLLVAGGAGRADVVLDTAIRFDHNSSAWEEVEAIPFEIRQTGGFVHEYISFNQGGHPWGEAGALISGMSFSRLTDRLAWFEPTSGSWQELEPAVTKRAGATTGVLSDGQILVFGGFDDEITLQPAEIYDPSTGRWSTAAARESGTLDRHLGNLPDGRAAFILLEFRDVGAEAFISLYAPTSDSWNMIEMPVWLEGMSVVMLPGGRLLATGGKFGLFDYEPSAWIFVP